MAKAKSEVNFAIKLKLKKSTKGKHVYGEDGDNPKIESVYIDRASVGGDEPPAELEVTVKAAG